MGLAALLAIRTWPRTLENEHSSFASHQKPAPVHPPPQSPRLPDRECHPGLYRQHGGSLSPAHAGGVLSGCPDLCQRQPESGSSSEPGFRLLSGLFKTVDHFLRHWILPLDLLKDSVLIPQVGVNLSRVFQNEGDGPIHFQQRPNGWVGLKNRFRRASASKIANHDV